MTQNKKVLVVSVHPDDETLGCGGTINKLRDQGNDIYWLILTNVKENFGWPEEMIEKRQVEIEKVSGLYKFKKVFKLDYPTTELDKIALSTLISSISKVINEVQPNIIITNYGMDVHSDHRIAFDAVYSCTKNFRYPFIESIWIYECLSETEFAPALEKNAFIPNLFIDITEYFDAKQETMKVYESEVMEANLPRNPEIIEALARFRGSRIGVKYAEAFMNIFTRI